MSTRLNDSVNIELHIQAIVRDIATFTKLTAKSATKKEKINEALNQIKIFFTLYLMLQSLHCSAKNVTNSLLSSTTKPLPSFDLKWLIQHCFNMFYASNHDVTIEKAHAQKKMLTIEYTDVKLWRQHPHTDEIENMIAALATKHVKDLADKFAHVEDIDRYMASVFSKAMTNNALDLNCRLSSKGGCRLLEQVIHSRAGAMCILFLTMNDNNKDKQDVSQYLAEIDSFYAKLTEKDLKAGLHYLEKIAQPKNKGQNN